MVFYKLENASYVQKQRSREQIVANYRFSWKNLYFVE